MRCLTCHGIGGICPECGGCGITSCCEGNPNDEQDIHKCGEWQSYTQIGRCSNSNDDSNSSVRGRLRYNDESQRS